MGIFKTSSFLDFEFSPPFLFIIITTTFSLLVQSTKTIVHNEDNINNPYTPITPPPQPPMDTTPMPKVSSFRPSIAVFVGILLIIVCFTFLIILYAKHCKGAGLAVDSNHYNTSSTRIDRINSGVERTVVESLPTFRFKSLKGQKEGLECAVCLNKFEPTEVLRLLPKCKHAFHVECLDTWLDIHSTCPLCRYRVHPEDILLVDHCTSSKNSSSSGSILFGGAGGVPAPPPPPPLPPLRPVRSLSDGGVDGVVLSRHSSPGERGSSSFLEVIVEQPSQGKRKSTTSLLSSKRSWDGWKGFGKKSSSTNKTTIPRLSGTRSLDISHDSSVDRLRKDGLLLDIKNKSTGRSEVQNNGVEQSIPPRQGEGSGGGGLIRHSSAGDAGSSSLLKVISENKIQSQRSKSTSFFSNTRRSIDGWMSFNKKSGGLKMPPPRLTGDNDHRRKDGLLLGKKKANNDEMATEHHRLDHMIIIGGPEIDNSGPVQRWSDVQPSDMLYLQSEMILSKSSILGQEGRSSSKVINDRSVSEMTGLSRFRNHDEQQRHNNNGRDNRQSNNVRGAVSRWKAWISKSKSESKEQLPSSSSGVDDSASTSLNVV